jgi:hypothetical protein
MFFKVREPSITSGLTLSLLTKAERLSIGFITSGLAMVRFQKGRVHLRFRTTDPSRFFRLQQTGICEHYIPDVGKKSQFVLARTSAQEKSKFSFQPIILADTTAATLCSL